MKHFGQWLAPPVFVDDKEKTWRAALLNSAILLVILMMSMILIGNLIGGRKSWLVLVIDVVAIGSMFLLRSILHKGRVELSGKVTLFLGFSLIAMGQAVLGTVRTPTTAMFMQLIILSGLLFGRSGYVLTTIASSLAVLGLIMAENASLLPDPDYVVNITQWISYTFIFALTGVLIDYSFRKTTNALTDSIKRGEELEEATKALIESDAKYRAIFDESVAGLILVDKELNILECNHAAAKIIGYRKDELQEMKFSDFIVDHEAFLEDHRQLLSGFQLNDIEYQFTRKNDKRLTVQTTSRQFLDGDGVVKWIQISLIDITNQQKS